jgi:GT2 family glycosyltransferase
MRATTAPVVAYIDDDCLVTEGWTAGIERAFADPRIGFVTGRVLADRDSKLPISVVTGETPRRFDALQDPVAFGGGANMAFRRTAFEQVGGFDEHMGPATRMLAAEDQDVFWRIVRAGWAGAYDPSITVVHQQWRTTGEAVRRQFAYGIGSGAFAVKVRRLEPEQGWAMLRSRLWGDGIKQGWRALRSGYETGAVSGVVRAAGVLVGTARALRTPLAEGHFSR